MEHLAFYDYQLQQGYSTKSLKSKQELLFNNKHLQDVITALQNLFKTSEKSNALDGTLLEKICNLMDWLHGQLSSTMKETIKYLNNKQYSSFCKIDLKMGKRMFELVIRGSVVKLPIASEKLNSVCETLIALNEIYSKEFN